jgi:hypothetical protein
LRLPSGGSIRPEDSRRESSPAEKRYGEQDKSREGPGYCLGVHEQGQLLRDG